MVARDNAIKYIITRNKEDFKESNILITTAEEFIKKTMKSKITWLLEQTSSLIPVTVVLYGSRRRSPGVGTAHSIFSDSPITGGSRVRGYWVTKRETARKRLKCAIIRLWKWC